METKTGLSQFKRTLYNLNFEEFFATKLLFTDPESRIQRSVETSNDRQSGI